MNNKNEREIAENVRDIISGEDDDTTYFSNNNVVDNNVADTCSAYHARPFADPTPRLSCPGMRK